jgi:hypothetical protein
VHRFTASNRCPEIPPFKIVLQPATGTTLPTQSVLEAVQGNPDFHLLDPAGNHLSYRCADTRVTASFTLQRNSTGSGDFCSAIECEMDYARPGFFAYEVLIAVQILATRHNLTIWDPQRRTTVPVEDSIEQLYESWGTSNLVAVTAMQAQGFTPVVLDPERSWLVDVSVRVSGVKGSVRQSSICPPALPHPLATRWHYRTRYDVGQYSNPRPTVRSRRSLSTHASFHRTPTSRRGAIPAICPDVGTVSGN